MSIRMNLSAFLENESGSVMIEYGVIASLMFIAVIAVFPQIVASIRGRFQSIQSPFDAL
jgi:Flp pilus assembly pilin Flp